jgi:uncharacterized membrane protein
MYIHASNIILHPRFQCLSGRRLFMHRAATVIDELGGVILISFFSKIYNLLYNGAINKDVIRTYLCGAIIQL